METPEKIAGKIKTLLLDKKYGFIRADDGEDFFFHKTGLEQTTVAFEDLKEGMRVEFTPVPDSARGPRAIEVRVL
jgi:cold shock CspA family protein